MSELSWISTDKLIDIAVKRFQKIITEINKPSKQNLATDPTLTIIRAGITGKHMDDSADYDNVVKTTKTLQNAIGLFHQDILGAASDWQEIGGTAGGLLDIRSLEPVVLASNRVVSAEVKMRYNTIKASDESKTFDNLKNAAQLAGGSKHAVSYLFQIIPNKQQSYDKPWKVSGREELEYVRVADGVTAYHIVTGDKNALFDLLHKTPEIIAKAVERITGIPASPETFSSLESINQTIANSLPEKSAHA